MRPRSSEKPSSIRRGDIAGLQPLDVALQGGASERIPKYQLAIDLLSIAPERRRRHVDDLGIRKAFDDFLPARSSAVVRLVDNNHIEEIVRKLCQPFIDVRRRAAECS